MKHNISPFVLLALTALLAGCGTSKVSSEIISSEETSEVVSSSVTTTSSSYDYEDEEYTPIYEKGFTKVKSAKSYEDLPIWNKYPDSYWKTFSPYRGKRDDFRDETIYFMMTTRFYDGDKSNNARCWDGRNNPSSDPEWRGDFKGLIEKMDYIKALGFTAIWITPVVENASGYDYHGYHAINCDILPPLIEVGASRSRIITNPVSTS